MARDFARVFIISLSILSYMLVADLMIVFSTIEPCCEAHSLSRWVYDGHQYLGVVGVLMNVAALSFGVVLLNHSDRKDQRHD